MAVVCKTIVSAVRIRPVTQNGYVVSNGRDAEDNKVQHENTTRARLQVRILSYPHKFFDIGASFNGRTVVSKTTNVGSIPTAPANKFGLIKFYIII